MNTGMILGTGTRLQGARRYIGARGDTIPNGEVIAIGIIPGDSLYDASGNVYYTNSTATTIQPGVVSRVVDAGNNQFMYEIDTTGGPTPLNIGTVYTAPITPDPNINPNTYAYFQAQAQGAQSSPAGAPDGNASGTGDKNQPGKGGTGGLGWFSSPGWGPFTKGESLLLTVIAIGFGAVVISNASKS